MLSDELIAKIANGLDAMPPKPASRRELDLLLTGIEAKIRAAQERGATYAEIAAQISESGYPVKSSTLGVALLRRKKIGTAPKLSSQRDINVNPKRVPARATATPPPCTKQS
ncbi:MAG TPA: hypothetical protein VGF86_09175 [Candidatus Tumulicola sp.]|jgi:hypothetical protein